MTDYRRISVLIHGWWGAGKSWLADSAPGPKLVISTENGFWDTPSEKWVGAAGERTWNPRHDAPELKGKGDIVVVADVTKWEDMELIMQHLLRGDHDFETVIIDSLHELQYMLKQAVAKPGESYDPNATFEMQAWGRLLNNLSLVLRQLRDLTRPSSPKPVNVIIVSGSDQERLPATPLLEGGIRKQIAGWIDLMGFLYIAQSTGGEEVRVMQIAPSSEREAKCRLHLLKVKHNDGRIVEPNIRKILATINPKEKS